MKKPDRAKETAQPYPDPGDDDRRVRLTYDDYCALPEGLRYELVEGDLRMVPSPNALHQRVVKRLGLMLIEGLERPGKGEVCFPPFDVVLSEHNVVQPDLLFIARDRQGIVGEANVQGPPDLVVEIISKSSKRWDRVIKRRVYARFGVREFWLVDLEAKSIEVAAREDQDLVTAGVYPAGTTARGPLLPDFAVEVADLFKD